MDFLPRGIIASGPHNGGGLDMTILNGLSLELSPAQQAFLSLTPQQRAAAAQQKSIFNGLGQVGETLSFPWLPVALGFLAIAIIGYGVSKT